MNTKITQFIQEERANGKKESTIKNTVPTLRGLDERMGGGIDKATKQDITNYILSWKDAKESSKATRKAIIKRFFTWLGKGDLVKDIRTKIPNNHLKADDILDVEDINKLIEATDSHFYKALIAFLFESGCRIGEAEALKVQDFKETDKGMIVQIPTFKTNYPYRNVILPFSASYLRNYFMYSNKGKDCFVFDLDRSSYFEALQTIKKKAKITKPVSLHKFRHSQATDLVRRGYNEAIIRKKLGWSPTSTMIARYQHLNDSDVIEATLNKSGIEIHKPVITDLNQPEKISIADAAMQFSKLTEELQHEKEKREKLEKDMDKITKFLEMGGLELLKNGHSSSDVSK